MYDDFLKDETYRDEDYLNFIRERPCCVCGKVPDSFEPSHPHHCGKNRGMGLKCSDYETVPLCSKHHSFGMSCVHSIGNNSFQEVNIIDFKNIIIEMLSAYIQGLKNGQ